MIVSQRPTLLAAAALLAANTLLAQKTPILITADLSDAPRKLYHAEVDIPVKPGIVLPHHTPVDPRQPPPHRPGR